MSNRLNSPEDNCPAYMRARIKFIENRLQELPKDEVNQAERKLLRYGVIQNEEKHLQDICIIMKNENYKNHNLKFTELTRYNTWFALHSEKVCGKEIITSSQEFPLSIQGTKEDIINTIRSFIAPVKDTKNMNKIKAKAKALQMKMCLQKSSDWYSQFQGLDGLDAMQELGELGELVVQKINQHVDVIQKIIQDDKKYSATDKLSFDEVVRLYNQGITEDEIKAWVWFQRGRGEKMLGWEKYFLKTNLDTKTSVSVKGKNEMQGRIAIVKDNHFRDILELGWGSWVGTFTGKKHEYDKDQYLIIRTDDSASNGLPKNALVYIKEKDVELVKHNASINDKLLVDYVKKGTLYYLNGTLVPYPIYAYGNMYDRELQLEADKSHILEHYGKEVYERQYTLIMNPLDKGGVRPKMLSVINPDVSQRPKILAISQFAKEFKVSTLKDETGIDLPENMPLFEVFKIWLESLDKSQFKNLTPYQIIKYYLDGDNLSKYLSEEEKSSIEKYGMLEAEELFTRFLYEAVTFEDQQKIDFSWNRTFNGHSAIPYNRGVS